MQQDRFAALISGLELSGLSQPEIARESGVSRTTVWRMGAGLARSPSYDTVRRIESLVARNLPAVSPLKRNRR